MPDYSIHPWRDARAYAVDGKQYIAIASGLFRNAKNKLARSPEMRAAAQATVIWVFGL